MGCDVTVLSKHNLNITNVETLAFDLAKRLNLNMDYGYYAVKVYNDLLENNLEVDLIILGTINSNKTEAKYLLVDEKYQAKQLYQIYGDKLFEMKEYWHWSNNEIQLENIKQEKKDIEVADYFLESIISTIPNEYEYLNIYDEIIENNLFYYSRWWSFCSTIQQNKELDYLRTGFFQQYRKAVMESTLALGGEKVYFVNDQCKHLEGVGQGNGMYYNWNDLEEFINSREILEIISISKIILDIEFQNEVAKKNQRNLAFIDDFIDLKTEQMIKNRSYF